MGTLYTIDGDLLDNIADAINTAKARPNAVQLETLNVTQNDTVNAPSGKAWNSVTVNVPTGAKVYTITSADGSAVDLLAGVSFPTYAQGLPAANVFVAIISGNYHCIEGTGDFDVQNCILSFLYDPAIHNGDYWFTCYKESSNIGVRLGFWIDGDGKFAFWNGNAEDGVSSMNSFTLTIYDNRGGN